MAIYGWKLADNSGNPVPEQNWNTPASWIAYPVANPPVPGTVVPAAGDDAFIGAGTVNVSVSVGPFVFPFNNEYDVAVDVTDSRTVANLGLGGMSITGLNRISPVFGTPTVFPTVKVTGGSLDVAGNLVNTFSGTIAIPIPVVRDADICGNVRRRRHSRPRVEGDPRRWRHGGCGHKGRFYRRRLRSAATWCRHRGHAIRIRWEHRRFQAG